MLLGLRKYVAHVLPPMPRLDRRARLTLVGLLVAALVLRLAWGIFVAEPPRGPQLHDPVLYLILADNVAHGHGYSYGDSPDQGVTAFYPPGYPMALAGVVKLVSFLPWTFTIFGILVGFNIVLSVLTVAIIFELGRRLVSVPVGLIAAAVIALWPNLVVYTGVALTETLFLFLFSLMLLVLLASPQVARAPGVLRMLTVGVLFGATVMVRPISIVVAPVFLLLWWRPDGVVVALKRAALIGVGTLALILPWTVRNAVKMDSFVLISTNMGDNLCIGNHPGASGSYGLPEYCNLGMEGDPGGRRPEIEITRQNDNIDLALEHIRSEPLNFFTKMPAKLRWTLDRDTDGLWAATDYGQHDPLSPNRMDLLELLCNGFYIVVGLVGMVGAVLLYRRWDTANRRVFLLVAALIQLVPPLITFGDARFKMPVYPALAISFAVAVTVAVERWRPRAESSPATTATEDRVPAEIGT